EAAMGFGGLRMVHPEVTVLEADDVEESGPPILPVYEKPTAMHGGVMRRLVQAAATDVAERVPSVLPPTVAARARVVDIARALAHVHLPAAEADIEALGEGRSIAHRSLVFDELFFLQLGLALRRSAVVAEAGTAFAPSQRLADALRGRLGVAPTGAQERAVAEIARDLAVAHPMRRLLQGDVGSGKTLVAVMAALGVLEAGHQVALMAPTELLAEQHHVTVGPWLRDLGIEVGLVTG